MPRELHDLPRLDVLSLKGGVGKTTVTWLLARHIARARRQPVLVIDADLTGTCLGDLVLPSVEPAWNRTPNLAHLITGHPEALADHLRPDTLPVYTADQPDPGPARRVGRDHAAQPVVLLAPSHMNALPIDLPGGHLDAADREVLLALMGHESAGGWVAHVIEEVIRATAGVLGTPPAAVIVDHAPGLAALPWSALRSPWGHKLLVTSADAVDLKMVAAFLDALERPDAARVSVLANRDFGAPSGWDTHADWYQNRLQLADLPVLAQAYRSSSLSGFDETALAGPLDGIARKVLPGVLP